MKCPACSGEMALTDLVCPRCHTARPQWPPVFEETARRFADLKARFQAGQLDTAGYEAALRELMVEHEGTFWTLGAEIEMCRVGALQVRSGGRFSVGLLLREQFGAVLGVLCPRRCPSVCAVRFGYLL